MLPRRRIREREVLPFQELVRGRKTKVWPHGLTLAMLLRASHQRARSISFSGTCTWSKNEGVAPRVNSVPHWGTVHIPLGDGAYPTGGWCVSYWGTVRTPLGDGAYPTGGRGVPHWGTGCTPLGDGVYPTGGRCVPHGGTGCTPLGDGGYPTGGRGVPHWGTVGTWVYGRCPTGVRWEGVWSPGMASWTP
jgi:hypothetical protein